MTGYTVQFTTAAAKEVRMLDGSIRRRVVDAIAKLEKNPRPAGTVKPSGFSDAWRIRVGDYRVLFEIIDREVLVIVFRVGGRDDVYERL